MEDYYSILQVSKGAKHDEIRNAYRKLTLKYHPDKQNEGDESKFSLFLKVQEAWNILSDPTSRENYNKKLSNIESFQCLPVDQEINFKDMSFDNDSKMYKKGCRCGGEYAVPKDEIIVEEDLQLYCDSCSLCIRVKANHIEL